jgi:tetratricopeptide (TPR) repeat protein
MIPWNKINELHRRSAELKLEGDFAGMLPLREEAAELLERNGAGKKQLANCWNYIAYINLQIGDLPAAEGAARRSLSLYREHTSEKTEQLATYLWLLAVVLEKRARFAEALPYAEESLSLFARIHGRDTFVTARRADVERIREKALQV